MNWSWAGGAITSCSVTSARSANDAVQTPGFAGALRPGLKEEDSQSECWRKRGGVVADHLNMDIFPACVIQFLQNSVIVIGMRGERFSCQSPRPTLSVYRRIAAVTNLNPACASAHAAGSPWPQWPLAISAPATIAYDSGFTTQAAADDGERVDIRCFIFVCVDKPHGPLPSEWKRKPAPSPALRVCSVCLFLCYRGSRRAAV